MANTELEKEFRKLEERVKSLEQRVKSLETNPNIIADDNKMEITLSHYLRKLGVSPNLLGYTYLRDAIFRGIRGEEIYPVTKVLYPNIAKKYNSTPTRVERAMRHAIKKTCLIGNFAEIQKLFGYVISTEKGTITVSEFISTIVDEIQLSQKRTV